MTKPRNGEKRARLELEILYRISQAMLQQQDVPALLDEVLDIMEREMGLVRGTLTLRRPGTDVFVIEASRGLSAKEKEAWPISIG